MNGDTPLLLFGSIGIGPRLFDGAGDSGHLQTDSITARTRNADKSGSHGFIAEAVFLARMGDRSQS